MVYLIDSGHGGFVADKYQTDPKIGKFFTHPGNPTFYEGVYNRLIKELLLSRLRENGLKYVDICATHLDLSLTTRVAISNQVALQFGASNCLLISLHSNAGGGRGFEIFTSPGQTKSDHYAVEFVNHFKRFFPEIPLRMDLSDKDPDKEEKFTMVTGPICPAILPEFLFYDNYDDYKLLIDINVSKRYADMLLSFCKYCQSNII